MRDPVVVEQARAALQIAVAGRREGRLDAEGVERLPELVAARASADTRVRWKTSVGVIRWSAVSTAMTAPPARRQTSAASATAAAVSRRRGCRNHVLRGELGELLAHERDEARGGEHQDALGRRQRCDAVVAVLDKYLS